VYEVSFSFDGAVKWDAGDVPSDMPMEWKKKLLVLAPRITHYRGDGLTVGQRFIVEMGERTVITHVRLLRANDPCVPAHLFCSVSRGIWRSMSDGGFGVCALEAMEGRVYRASDLIFFVDEQQEKTWVLDKNNALSL
jgi:hypothetical protein